MSGGVLGIVGFLLSPLSWWNDLVVNIPLAVGFGWLVSLVYKPAFDSAVIVGYWLTNVIGLILMHKGVHLSVSGSAAQRYTRKSLLKDVGVSLAYTAIIVVLIRWNVLKPVKDY